jgi:hypothetical protein
MVVETEAIGRATQVPPRRKSQAGKRRAEFSGYNQFAEETAKGLLRSVTKNPSELGSPSPPEHTVPAAQYWEQLRQPYATGTVTGLSEPGCEIVTLWFACDTYCRHFGRYIW